MRVGRRNELLLAVGMAAGAALAAFSLLGGGAKSGPDPSEGAVAMVGGQAISRASFDTAIALAERDRNGPLSGDERLRILERLVDEELLLQRGLALGLARSDGRVRGDLVAAVIEAATAEADLTEPSSPELVAFFEENRASFEGPASLRLAQVFVASPPRSDEEALRRAREAFERLRAGEDLATVRRELGDPPGVEIPASFQPASRLRDYVGAAAASVVQHLRAMEVTEPQRSADGYRVLVVLERADAVASTFEQRRADVLAEYRRRAGEQSLRFYLDRLRRSTDVTVSLPLEDAEP